LNLNISLAIKHLFHCTWYNSLVTSHHLICWTHGEGFSTSCLSIREYTHIVSFQETCYHLSYFWINFRLRTCLIVHRFKLELMMFIFLITYGDLSASSFLEFLRLSVVVQSFGTIRENRFYPHYYSGATPVGVILCKKLLLLHRVFIKSLSDAFLSIN
jgi:hypothetical protein